MQGGAQADEKARTESWLSRSASGEPPAACSATGACETSALAARSSSCAPGPSSISASSASWCSSIAGSAACASRRASSSEIAAPLGDAVSKQRSISAWAMPAPCIRSSSSLIRRSRSDVELASGETVRGTAAVLLLIAVLVLICEPLFFSGEIQTLATEDCVALPLIDLQHSRAVSY